MSVDAKALYNRILETANLFLHQSKRFSVDVLAEENPTYEELAEIMEKLSRIIFVLSDDFDPLMCQKAVEYCGCMKQMGIAIKNHNQEELSKLVDELSKRPFV